MLGRDDHIGGAEQGVGTGGVHGDILAHVGLEGDVRAGGAADPVLLLGLDTLDIVQIVQIVDQALGILGDAQHPLALFLLHHLAAAALAHAVDDLLVGQHHLAAGAPVDGHGGLIGHVVLEQLQEDPLGPLVVLGVRGVDAAIPVKAVAQHLQLAGEVGDVVVGDDGGMDVVLDGEVLGGQAEGVVADGEQDVIALHALFTGHDVDGRKGTGMAHMQALCGGIGKLDQAVKLLPGLVAGDGAVGLGLFPVFLPFLFNGRKIVIHACFSFV